MKSGKRLKFQGLVWVIFFIVSAGCAGCRQGNNTEPDKSIQVREVSVPSEIDAAARGNITISGKGFAAGDKIRLTLATDESRVYTADILSFDDKSASFALPEGFTTGRYKIVLIRGSQELTLGSSSISIVMGGSLPDIPGKTIKGLVHSNGTGVAGVVVSDGYEVTVTDAKGVYYLASEKKNGFVFISVPGNYEAPVQDNLPQFFKRLTSSNEVEQKDFSLIPATNSKHTVLALSDWHLANRNNDLQQLGAGFLPDVNAAISEYTAAGSKVYGLAMGDMSWDAYWYENNFGLVEYLAEMKKVNCAMFNVIGNHDNDPYVQGDRPSEVKYREVIGPTYYSFNLGEIHYVVLDNIEYVNTGGTQGKVGERNYNDVITADQIEWLKKDLATLKDKSAPVIIAMHAPLHRTPTLNADGTQVSNLSLNNAGQFLSAIQGFSEVHVLSGHIHTNYTVAYSQAVTEYNMGAVCATWWWTGRNGYANNHICKDGSPGGYGVMEVEGRKVKWYYKSIGKPKSYQFRSYDLNKVHITTGKYAPNAAGDALAEYAGTYASPNLNNEVLINVWGYGPGWSIEVKEGGTTLPVKQVSGLDPLHIISYEAKRLNAGAVPTASFETSNTVHLFKVTASGPASTLEIKVTDRSGTVYSETMTRPKEFTYTSD